MRLPRTRDKAPDGLAPGERVLAWADTDRGPVGGSRDALHLPDGAVPWERLQAADWDLDTTTLRVSEVGTWGEPRPEHVFVIEEPRLLLELVRERITASVVLQRHVPVDGRRGVRVIARRAPRGDQPVAWVFEYDEGIDPDDPLVRTAADDALLAARDELGLT
ncbi:hypothetical protein H5V45_18870 [Nocardioides sp. KIGAM211]|uniref:Uncharacterized protein n=1 Tax=Nocardioides luti TaxID=2761101 RepID=A0A7X0VCT9_9ACTN|nr:hypothetical protein [Nocardioides luti]MBB6629397.1 hypothetical protein [Nocardioides luti]